MPNCQFINNDFIISDLILWLSTLCILKFMQKYMHVYIHIKSEKKILQFNMIHSSAGIMWSNITWHCTHHCRNRGRISESKPTKKPPQTLSQQVSYGLSFVNILEKFGLAIMTPHCRYVWVSLWQYPSYQTSRCMYHSHCQGTPKHTHTSPSQRKSG